MRPGKLYFGDNLYVLRGTDFRSDSVDLVYLDPPFNSNREYNVLFQERDLSASFAQIKAFEDCWHWDQDAQSTFEDLTGPEAPAMGVPGQVSTLIGALYAALPKRNDMLAYLVMMTPRLIELRRVLKPTGTLYLHCDPTASHYLKLVLDLVFGPENFRNEIIWKRTGAHNSAKKFGPVHDVILCYGKTTKTKWNATFTAYSEKYLKKYNKVDEITGKCFQDVTLTGSTVVKEGDSSKPWRHHDPTAKGRHWAIPDAVFESYRQITGDDLGKYSLLDRLTKIEEAGLMYLSKKGRGGLPRYKQFLEDGQGTPISDVWTDIDVVNSQASERLGYPTQKPMALLERILEASTNPGDVVLDPFCGCGTTIEAAQKLGREWIGIDITALAISVVRNRLAGKYRGIQYELHGDPVDIESARMLAETAPYEFQWWALHKIGARPFGGEHGGREGKRGRDRGVDGFIKFRAGDGKVKDVIVSVKGGRNVTPAFVRELRGTIERLEAPIGVLITMQEPTKEMLQEAISASSFKSGGARYPRLQILSVKDLFKGKTVQYPRSPESDQQRLPGLASTPPPPRKGHRVQVPVDPPTAPSSLEPKKRRSVTPVDVPLTKVK